MKLSTSDHGQGENRNALFNNPFLGSRGALFHMVVWPHGVDHTELILNLISESGEFRVVQVIEKKDRNLNRIIRDVYRNDYAPIHHLKRKLATLKKASNSGKVVHIFLEASNPRFDVRGAGKFRHLYSQSVDDLKWEIRGQLNEYEKGEITDKHVVHACDNPHQALYYAEILGLGAKTDHEGLGRTQAHGIMLPLHISPPKSLRFCTIDIQQLRARIFYEDELIEASLSETPHFRFLEGSEANSRTYGDYVRSKRGREFRDGHSTKQFTRLLWQIQRGEKVDPILVTKSEDGTFLIRDGIHRATVYLYLGHEKVKVAVIE